MIRLNKIIVSNYKNIERADLKINDFNVVVGANNTGKSNLLQVVSLLNYVTNGGSYVQDSFNNGFRFSKYNEIVPMCQLDKKDSGNIVFELHFENTESNNKFEYLLDLKWIKHNRGTRYVIEREKLYFKDINQTGKLIRIFERNLEGVNDKSTKINWGTHVGSKKNIESIPVNASVIPFCDLLLTSNIEIEGYSDAVRSLKTVLKAPIIFISNHAIKQGQEQFSDDFGRHISIEIEKEVAKIIDDENKNFIFKNAIKEILNITDIRDLKFKSGENEKLRFVFFEHDNIVKKVESLSDGTLSILAIICKVLNTDSSLIMIEEPENSTHPKALLDLIDFIKSFRAEKQFIITSHSIALLNNSSIDEIIVGGINEKGLSEFCNVSDKEEIASKLKNKYSNFSDNIFFSEEEEEDEIFG